jgi:hypothetical protein
MESQKNAKHDPARAITGLKEMNIADCRQSATRKKATRLSLACQITSTGASLSLLSGIEGAYPAPPFVNAAHYNVLVFPHATEFAVLISSIPLLYYVY